MKNYIALVFVSFFFFTSCVTYNHEQLLKASKPLKEKFSGLVLEIDSSSFNPDFGIIEFDGLKTHIKIDDDGNSSTDIELNKYVYGKDIPVNYTWSSDQALSTIKYTTEEFFFEFPNAIGKPIVLGRNEIDTLDMDFILEKNVETIEIHTYAGITDSRLYDLYKRIDYEFEKNFSSSSPNKTGYFVVRLKNVTWSRPPNWSWFIPSTLTVYTINFLGFPIYESKAQIEIEVLIFDKNRKILTSYSGIGKKKNFSAMYWGYSMSAVGNKEYYYDTPLHKSTWNMAISSAFKLIKSQIENDYSEINNKLQNPED